MFDRDNPLDVNLLVFDQASMLDLIVANKLIKAVPSGVHVLLVGNIDQLPSVWAVEVLRGSCAAVVGSMVLVGCNMGLPRPVPAAVVDGAGLCIESTGERRRKEGTSLCVQASCVICNHPVTLNGPVRRTEHPVSAPRQWTTHPAVQQAVLAGDYPTILRFSRLAAGLTLEQLGAAGGYSMSTLSRLESRRRRIRDVDELRRLAYLYDVPVHLFGLASSPGDGDGSSLARTADGGGDTVDRRNFLAGAAVVGVAAALPSVPAAAAPSGGTIEEVLFGRLTADPLPAQQLAAQLAAARADFHAARYTRLARRLPKLLAQAVASRSGAGIDESGAASERLAEAYGVAAQLLIKLHDDGMACALADRAVQTAAAGNDPLIMAESRRLAATVLRRIDHRHSAQKLVLDAAAELRSVSRTRDAAYSAMYGQLLAVAAYTAAIRDDRDTAWTLLGEAEQPARDAGLAARFNSREIAVYRISVARKLGDYGAAVDFARKVDPRAITGAERRARYWEDTALALQGRGRPEAAFDALLTAEHDVPEEVRYRPWAQQLTRELLSAPASHGLAGVREFAKRVGIA